MNLPNVYIYKCQSWSILFSAVCQYYDYRQRKRWDDSKSGWDCCALGKLHDKSCTVLYIILPSLNNTSLLFTTIIYIVHMKKKQTKHLHSLKYLHVHTSVSRNRGVSTGHTKASDFFSHSFNISIWALSLTHICQQKLNEYQWVELHSLAAHLSHLVIKFSSIFNKFKYGIR